MDTLKKIILEKLNSLLVDVKKDIDSQDDGIDLFGYIETNIEEIIEILETNKWVSTDFKKK